MNLLAAAGRRCELNIRSAAPSIPARHVAHENARLAAGARAQGFFR
jgi:hypothetical protein